MKKKFLLAFLGIAVCGAVLYAQSLDEAILSAAIKISRELPAGASVAIINFNSSSENLNEYVLDELYGAILRNHGVVPVKPNPGQFQTIRDGFKTAGELNSESGRSIGKLLGVQYLITGSIKRNGELYNIVFNAVNMDVEIKSQYQASLNPRGDLQFASLLGDSSQFQPSAGTASASQPKTVTIAAIAGVAVPTMGTTPVKAITENAQYTGTVTWSPEVSGTFELNTQYTATITLTAKRGYTFKGVTANFFKVAGTASASNNADSGVVTAVFKTTKKDDNAKLNTLGVSVGTSFPNDNQLTICTVHGTFAPFNYSFFELGVDAGWSGDAVGILEGWILDVSAVAPRGESDIKNFGYYYSVDLFSLNPFVNYVLFLPFSRTKQGKRAGGWYLGAGLGVMFTNYTFNIEETNIVETTTILDTAVVMNIVTGFNLGIFDISYTLRTDFNHAVGKLSIGYVYRF